MAAKGFEVHGRATCKAELLARIEARVPWAQFCALIGHTFRAGNGRPPVGLERMLRLTARSGSPIHRISRWIIVQGHAGATISAAAVGPKAHAANHRDTP